jgi:serine/threonine protein kinase
MDTLKKIGPYQIIKRIAEGGMAEVFLGKTEARFGVSKLVAIKTTLQTGNPQQLKEMFFNEIRMSANLSHQNIVKIYDFGEFENRGYMAMEYINGVTLRQLMNYLRDNNERLSSSFILYIIHQASLGLAYAYQSVDPQTGRALKLIHRDISPQNILISFEGEVKIIDFGIATATKDKDLESSGQVKGKVAYMSPEQIQGKDVDSASDIFSLGIVLWELLANERFHSGTTVNDVKQSIINYDVDKLSKDNMQDRAEELLGILPIMLHQDLAKRARDANELARLLGTVLSSLHPDFSALALADYLRDIFSSDYQANLEQIRASIAEDEKTMVMNPAAEITTTDQYGELDEFEAKIAEGSYHSGVMLEKLTDLTSPLPSSVVTPAPDMWGLGPKPKPEVGPITVMPFYQFPKMRKMPQAKSSSSSFVMIFAVAFVVLLMGGISTGKIRFGEKKPIPVADTDVPTLTPEMIQKLRLSVQQPITPTPTPATAEPSAKKAPTFATRKALQKSRGLASAKPEGKMVEPLKAKVLKKPKLDLAHFKNGIPYPSGTKCVTNCPIKITSEGGD